MVPPTLAVPVLVVPPTFLVPLTVLEVVPALMLLVPATVFFTVAGAGVAFLVVAAVAASTVAFTAMRLLRVCCCSALPRKVLPKVCICTRE